MFRTSRSLWIGEIWLRNVCCFRISFPRWIYAREKKKIEFNNKTSPCAFFIFFGFYFLDLASLEIPESKIEYEVSKVRNLVILFVYIFSSWTLTFIYRCKLIFFVYQIRINRAQGWADCLSKGGFCSIPIESSVWCLVAPLSQTSLPLYQRCLGH